MAVSVVYADQLVVAGLRRAKLTRAWVSTSLGDTAGPGLSDWRVSVRAMAVSPLWISSLSALVLAVLGLAVQLRDRRLRWLESRDRGRAQADLVSAWTSWGGSVEARRTVRVLVSNASKQAIYDVFVDLRNPVSGAEERYPIGDLGPECTGEVALPGPVDAEAERWERRAMFPRLYFQDLRYQRWLRDSVGRLRPDNEDGYQWNSLETETAPGPGWRPFDRRRRFRSGW
jgi:hypothetical protein